MPHRSKQLVSLFQIKCVYSYLQKVVQILHKKRQTFYFYHHVVFIYLYCQKRILSVHDIRPMRNFSPFSTLMSKAKSKIYSFENIISNQWILVYPMQAVPAILFRLLNKMTRTLRNRNFRPLWRILKTTLLLGYPRTLIFFLQMDQIIFLISFPTIINP